jgi:hypothetical protein
MIFESKCQPVNHENASTAILPMLKATLARLSSVFVRFSVTFTNALVPAFRVIVASCVLFALDWFNFNHIVASLRLLLIVYVTGTVSVFVRVYV